MDRLERLSNLYRKVCYFQYDEEKDPQRSTAVLEACRIAKRVLWDEYYAIVDRRAGKPRRPYSAAFTAALSAVTTMDTRGNA